MNGYFRGGVITLVVLLTLLSPFLAFAQPIKVGTVTISQDSKKITIRNGVKKYHFDRSDFQRQVFLMTAPFAEVSGMDGSIEVSVSKGIINLPVDARMTAKSIPSFKFIGSEKKYIGFLLNEYGASGGSSQKRIIFDTTGQGVYEIDSSDMASPKWLRRGKDLVGFVEYNSSLYLSSHATSLGVSSRISDCYVFKKDGAAIDNAICKDICVKQYAAVVFSNVELKLLAKKGISDLPRELGVKLLDKVYYGLKAGKRSEVKTFVKNLNSEFRSELQSMLKEISPFRS